MIGGVLQSPDPCAYKPAKQNYKLESYRSMKLQVGIISINFSLLLVKLEHLFLSKCKLLIDWCPLFNFIHFLKSNLITVLGWQAISNRRFSNGWWKLSDSRVRVYSPLRARWDPKRAGKSARRRRTSAIFCAGGCCRERRAISGKMRHKSLWTNTLFHSEHPHHTPDEKDAAC